MATKSEYIKSLANSIRESVDGLPVETQLATSQRIIARVTDGIYREPWAAFRELVANAYDADATRVIIETDAPEFDQIIVRDNGNGMSPETVAYIVSSIGGSSKRTLSGSALHTVKDDDPDQSPGGRPLIGKIGIGLFAVAQLTQHFQIITKAAGDEVRTSATVLLRTHDEDKLRVEKDETEYVAGTVTIKSERVPHSEIEAHGTSVVLYSLRPEIRRSLQSVRRWNAALAEGPDGRPVQDAPDYHIGLSAGVISKTDKGKAARLPWEISDSPEKKFEKLIKAAGDVSGRGTKQANLEHFDEHLRLIWQLSLSLPLDYVGDHPFDLDGSSGMLFLDVPDGRKQASTINLEKDETLRDRLGLIAGQPDPDGGFDVHIDGILLRRPINLPFDLRVNSRISSPVLMVAKEEAPFKDKDIERAGGHLRFEAYLYWNSKIVPKDTAGVIVRVREASGTLFDRNFLNYQVSEQTRLRQTTAEIFVQNGLDGAINIDRESFNYSHPHFLYIQKWLHKALRLLANRLKALAKEDLQKAKVARASAERKTRQSQAIRIWNARLGEDTDPPLVEQPLDLPPAEVGGTEIDWSTSEPEDDPAMASAIAVVLEAYGVLSNLDSRDRARLINDLLSILKPGAND